MECEFALFLMKESFTKYSKEQGPAQQESSHSLYVGYFWKPRPYDTFFTNNSTVGFPESPEETKKMEAKTRVQE